MMSECTTDSTSDSMRLTDEEIDKIINSEKSKSLQDPYGFSVVNKQIENLPRFSVSAKDYENFADQGVYLNAYTSRDQAEKQRIENQINNVEMGIVVAIILSALVAWMGARRKIGFGWAFFFSLMLSPVVGLIIVLCSRKREPDFVEMDK